MAGAAGQEQWSSKYGFLMAAIGSAVGLGNIWRFPYLTGTNGGGAFVLIYIACAVVIALPILVAELQLGRHGHKDPVTGIAMVAREAGVSERWKYAGALGALTGFIIVTFYSVVAGWALDFVYTTATGGLKGLSAGEASSIFGNLLTNPGRMAIWHTVFMGLTMVVVARGIQDGIEKAVKILMPALFVMLIVMVGYGFVMGDFAAGFNFLFAPDFSKINAGVVMAAIGQAFFSVGIAMGIMITYGSFLPSNVSIPKAAMIIVAADTGIALVAGLMIFPIVFANGLEPSSGAGLTFQTLPIVFAQMPFGTVMGTVFFMLLVFAALTSSISMIQPAVSWIQTKLNISTVKAALVVGLTGWVIGFGSVLGLNRWSDIHIFGWLKESSSAWLSGYADKNIMDTFDSLSADLMMPVGGMLVAIFVGWRVSEAISRGEFADVGEGWYRLWRFLIRYLAPIGVLAVLITNLF